MTEEDDRSVQEQMLAFTCGYCAAPDGEWCSTKSGARASYLHSARWWAWKNTQVEKHTQNSEKPNQEGTS